MAAGEPRDDSSEKQGRGRPKHDVRHMQDLAACEGMIWWASPWITAAMIMGALNGSEKLLTYLSDRIHGRIQERTPIADRLEKILAALPEDWSPEETFEKLREWIVGTPGSGPWTTSEASQVGRLGLEGLVQRANRGDFQAQMALQRAWMGDPVLSLGEQAATMTPEQLRETMLRRYAAAWPWLTHEDILRMVDAIQTSSADGEGK